MRATDARGFSLLEMVLTIVLIGILAAMAGQFMVLPVRTVMDQFRRGALTDAAASAVLQIARDVGAALPNSVRVTGGTALELLQVVDGERYRTDPPGTPADRLSFTAPDDSFNTLGLLGPLDPVGGPAVSYANHRLAVYPLGQPGADPYEADLNPGLDGVLTRAQTITVDDVAPPGPPGGGTEYRITLADDHRFPLESPAERVFLVSGPVSYICQGGALRRYSGYPLSAAQPATGGATGVAGVLVADQVESCVFGYQVVGQRRALVTIDLTLNSPSADGEPERVRLLRQLHVSNTP